MLALVGGHGRALQDHLPAEPREPPLRGGHRDGAHPRRHAELAGRRGRAEGLRLARRAREPPGQPDGRRRRQVGDRAAAPGCRPASSSASPRRRASPSPVTKAPSRRDFVLTTRVVTNTGGDQLPIIEVEAQAPDRAGAARARRRSDRGTSRLPRLEGRAPAGPGRGSPPGDRARRAAGRHQRARAGAPRSRCWSCSSSSDSAAGC